MESRHKRNSPKIKLKYSKNDEIEVIKNAGQQLHTMGNTIKKIQYINQFEALYLIEKNIALLYRDEVLLDYKKTYSLFCKYDSFLSTYLVYFLLIFLDL